MALQNQLPQAPRLHFRRPAHLIRLGALIMSVIILTMLLKEELDIRISLIWGVINLLAWLWELTVTFNKTDTLQLNETSTLGRRSYRRVIFFLVVVVVNLGIFLALAGKSVPRMDSIALTLVLYNLLVFAWLEYETFRWFIRGHNAELWITLSLVAGAFAGWTIWTLHPEYPGLGFGVGALTTLVNIVIFVMQRLGSEDRVRGDVIRSVILQILGTEQTREQWSTIVEQIHERLKYEHVSILEPGMDRSQLLVVAEKGGDTNYMGQTLPIGEGITGHAFLTGETVAWNDVAQCPYYKRLTAPALDGTRAEIAVPIQHQGITYGILDVQSRYKNAFRWDDKNTLEVIARILGVAISAQKTNLLIREAEQLWEELSSQYYSEESIFHEFARFAQEKLGADVITYYPLTPTGYPSKAPYHFGKLYVPERLISPIQHLNSPVNRMIHDWNPLFLDSIAPNSLLGKWGQIHPDSFAQREKVQSMCFVPVGTAREKVGVMFLNYRKVRYFDGLFRFMVLSFSQIFTMLASRNNFRDVVFEGFGRPELGIHNLLGRYGFKTGVVEEGEKIFNRACLVDNHSDFKQCGMAELLTRMDEFLQAVSLANSSIPPMFWEESLRDELEKFASTLPAAKSNRRPTTQVRIDVHVERESSWVKLALYRLITEAMNNAVFHGEASSIKVQTLRDDYNIIVKITNDGLPLPGDSDLRQSRRGIFALLTEFEKTFNAKTGIKPGTDNEGTIVEVVLPAIPLKFEVPHAENNPVS